MTQDVPRELQTVNVGNGAAPQKPEEIERQIELARSHLAATIDALAVRVSPKQVARRNAHRARAAFADDDGSVDKVKVGGVAAVAVVVLALVVWYRRSR